MHLESKEISDSDIKHILKKIKKQTERFLVQTIPFLPNADFMLKIFTILKRHLILLREKSLLGLYVPALILMLIVKFMHVGLAGKR